MNASCIMHVTDYNFTKVGVAVTLLTFIREVVCSNSADTLGILTDVLRLYSQSFQESSRIAPRIGHGRFLLMVSDSLSIYHHTLLRF
jgi:hypothetical protein